MFASFAARTKVSAGVAVHAQVDESTVVGIDSGPVRHTLVAGVACGKGRNVIGRFAGLGQARAVAGGAHNNAGLGVVKLEDRIPLGRKFVMAGLAQAAGRQTGQMFSGNTAGFHAVVATDAIASDGAVIHPCRCPGIRGMARVARQRGDDVCGTLTFYGKLATAIMADRAGRGRLDLNVIEGPRGLPACR